jgi:hypothetical protein
LVLVLNNNMSLSRPPWREVCVVRVTSFLRDD